MGDPETPVHLALNDMVPVIETWCLTWGRGRDSASGIALAMLYQSLSGTVLEGAGSAVFKFEHLRRLDDERYAWALASIVQFAAGRWHVTDDRRRAMYEAYGLHGDRGYVPPPEGGS